MNYSVSSSGNKHYMNHSTYSCGYELETEANWIKELDIIIGVVFLIISIATLFINLFVIYSFAVSKRRFQGTSVILVQVAFNDFISGIVGSVFSCNLLAGRTKSIISGSPVGNILLCQLYAILLDIIYITAPLLLAIATAFRVIAVLAPYKYQKINNDLKIVPIGLSALSWIFGAGVGLFPYFFQTWMCFSQTSGSCDYFVINVLGGNKDLTRLWSLCLFVLPGNIAYMVIVLGGIIVISKLFLQNRKTLARTTSRKEIVEKSVSDKGNPNLKGMPMGKTLQRRASHSELRMIQKELSVIRCTLALCATYFIAHFVTVSYNIVYMFKTDNTVFATMSGNNATGEVYLYAWFYLSHTIAGFVDGLVQIRCNQDMRKGMKSFVSRITSRNSEAKTLGAVYLSVNRYSVATSINNDESDTRLQKTNGFEVRRNSENNLCVTSKMLNKNNLSKVHEHDNNNNVVAVNKAALSDHDQQSGDKEELKTENTSSSIV